ASWAGAAAGGAAGGAAMPDGSGVSETLDDATYATATATITSGMTASPSDSSSSVAISTDVSGSLSITTIMAPIPIAAPATRGRPGACDSATPPAPPTK